MQLLVNYFKKAIQESLYYIITYVITNDSLLIALSKKSLADYYHLQ